MTSRISVSTTAMAAPMPILGGALKAWVKANSDRLNASRLEVPPASTNSWVKTLKSQITESTVSTAKTGFSSGKVIFQKIRHAEAPSTLAASYSSLEMLFNPASTETAMNGNEAQTTAMISTR